MEAQASWWLREMGVVTTEACQLEERRDAELALVGGHYAAALAPLTDRLAALERCGQRCRGELRCPGYSPALERRRRD